MIDYGGGLIFPNAWAYGPPDPPEPCDCGVCGACLEAEAGPDWRCECGDLNRPWEAFCYRCGAGPPEENLAASKRTTWPSKSIDDLAREEGMLDDD